MVMFIKVELKMCLPHVVAVDVYRHTVMRRLCGTVGVDTVVAQ